MISVLNQVPSSLTEPTFTSEAMPSAASGRQQNQEALQRLRVQYQPDPSPCPFCPAKLRARVRACVLTAYVLLISQTI